MKSRLYATIAILLLLASFTSSYSQTYTWTQKSNFGGGGRFVPFFFSIGNKGYTGSGITFTGTTYNYTAVDFWEYDPATDIWTQKANITGLTRSSGMGFSALGMGFLTTGWTPTPTRVTIKYNPTTNTWSNAANFGGAARYGSCTFTIGDDAYVGTGYSPLSKDFWRYNAHNDTWTQVAVYTGSARQAATGFAIGNKGYVTLGLANGVSFNTLHEYDPASNSWAQKANFPGTARFAACAMVLNNRGIVGVGYNNTTMLNDFYAYDPTTNSWSSVPTFPGAGRYGGMSLTIGSKGYIGAGASQQVPTANLLNDFWELCATPIATISPSANVQICPSGSVTLTAMNAPEYSFQWQLNGVDIPGATSQTYDAASIGNYTVIVTNPCGTSVSSIVNIATNTGNLPVANITPSGPTTFCQGGNVTLQTTAVAGQTYQWKDGGNDIIGAINASETFAAAGNYTVVVTNACGSSTSSPVLVTVLGAPNAALTLSGPTQLCPGATVTINAVYNATYSYQWFQNGVNIPAWSSSYTTSVAGNYTVQISNANCTVTSASVPVSIIAPLTPVVTAGGPTSFCTVSGGSVLLSTAIVPGATYQWRINNAIISGATNSFYTATIGGNNFFKVDVTNNCGTFTSTAILVNGQVSPSSNINVTGSTQLCPGGSVELWTSNTAGVTHQWKLNNVDIPGATAYNYFTSTAGSYTKTSTNACGSATSSPVVVSNINVPAPVISVPGPTTVCQNQYVYMYVPTVSGQTYQWNRNGVAVSGATTAGYYALIAGSYTITVTNACGTGTSAPVAVTVNPFPASTVLSGGAPTTFCQGGSILLYNVSGANLSHQWYRDGVLINGATNYNYTATVSGNYTVRVTYITTGCSSTTTPGQSVTVTVNPYPNAIITPSGQVSYCAGTGILLSATTGTGYTYVWKKQNSVIAGATSSTYYATTNGKYRVVVTAPGGCSATSAFTTTNSVNCPRLSQPDPVSTEPLSFTLNPNPALTDFKIELNQVPEAGTEIFIYDVNGRVVYQTGINSQQLTINSAEWTAGMYTVLVTNGTTREFRRIVKN